MFEYSTIFILFGAFGGYLFARLKNTEKVSTAAAENLATVRAQLENLNRRVYELEKRNGVVPDLQSAVRLSQDRKD